MFDEEFSHKAWTEFRSSVSHKVCRALKMSSEKNFGDGLWKFNPRESKSDDGSGEHSVSNCTNVTFNSRAFRSTQPIRFLAKLC